MNIFPKIINAILAKTKESRASLCHRTGISKTSLNDFLAGRKDLSFDAVIALVAAFPAYNARWLLTGVKSQAMIEHQKKLDAVNVVKPAIFPSDDVVIERFNKFCRSIGLTLINTQSSPTLANATTIGGDIIDKRTYINATTAHAALMELIKRYSGNEISFHTRRDVEYITAPDFFALI